MDREAAPSLQCPLPLRDYPHLLLAHGGGGRLMHDLIAHLFLPSFADAALEARHDGAVVDLPGAGDGPYRLAFSTDSYVVQPLFFPGGDIGTLAVNGTVNDLAMCGARPLYLSVGFILEEGLPTETLWRVVQSMRQAAAAARVRVIAGDTKVVDRGKGDGIFLNTAGIGVVEHPHRLEPASVAPGDVILLNGDSGRHGTAIMAGREGLAFETTIESDCAPLHRLVLALLDAGVAVHCLRDLTRGGLGTALVEIAAASRTAIAIDERAIPVRDEVQAACEILGLDPLYVACEGRFVAFGAPADAERALAIMRSQPLGAEACAIGRVEPGRAEAVAGGLVTLTTASGAQRLVDMPSGEQLPRIC
jgi:hydrogenase expression/formation protein HypE